MMLYRLLIMTGAEHTMLKIMVNLCFLVLRPRMSMVLQRSHNEKKRNTLKNSTCSHKWWETLKGLIFGAKHSVPALRGPLEVVWWWLLLRKPYSWALGLPASSVMSSLTESSAVSSLSLLCLVLSFVSSLLQFVGLSNFCPTLLLLDLDTYGGVDPLGMFHLFLKNIIVQN